MEEQLMKAWLVAKIEEQAANQRRVKIEQEILTHLKVPEEGSVTHDLGDYKVTVTTRLKRTIDERKWAVVRDQIPEQLRPIEVVESLKLVNEGFKWLRDNEPGYYKLVADVVTTKANKPGVLVKEIEQGE